MSVRLVLRGDIRPLIRKLAQMLDDANITYCLVHDWLSLGHHTSSDVDIIVAEHELRRVEQLLFSNHVFHPVLTVRTATSLYSVLRTSANGGTHLIAFDFATCYRFGGSPVLNAAELLEGRCCVDGIWTASHEAEFAYTLSKKIAKQAIPDHQRIRLKELIEKDEPRASRFAFHILGHEWGQRVIEWIKQEQWSVLEDRCRDLQRVITRRGFISNPVSSIRYTLGDLRHLLSRRFHPLGLLIVTLGADGAGKSTLAMRLHETFSGVFSRYDVHHFRPGMIFGAAKSSHVSNPHEKPPYPALLSVAKLLIYLADYLFGYIFHVWPSLTRSTLTVFDRYYHDLLADPTRYRFGGPMWLAWLVSRFIPRPDLMILLDLPAEVARQRKQEVALDQALQLRERYRALAAILPNAHVVDAALPPDEVLQCVQSIVLNCMESRERRWVGLNR